jgi:S-adenosylmethionine-diacylglycerol 3-amino-3-carboxypropyl transferase
MADQYFNALNYTMANEDTRLEYELLPDKTAHVLTIAGSGSRVLPLFAKFPKKMSIVDFSPTQIALTQTRIETVRLLNYEEFLAFWGYPAKPMNPKTRKDIFEKLPLTENNHKIMSQVFKSHSFGPLLYTGKYEKAIRTISKIIRTVLGDHIEQLKGFHDHADFMDYIYQDFPNFRWKMLVKLLGNSTMLNALLYKGSHPAKNINLSYAQYYEQLFNSLFRICTPRESFFLQLIFFGEVIDISGAPFEADPKIYWNMQQGIQQCDIQYYDGDLFEVIEQFDEKVDFVSFSDILSYFPTELGSVYLQKIRNNLNPMAITVHRYYLHVSRNLDCDGYEKITDKYREEINHERTQIYITDVYQKDIPDEGDHNE